MKVTVIPIVFRTPGTIPNGLVKGIKVLKIRGLVETMQTAVLLRSVRILGRSPGDLRRFAVTQIPVRNF